MLQLLAPTPSPLGNPEREVPTLVGPYLALSLPAGRGPIDFKKVSGVNAQEQSLTAEASWSTAHRCVLMGHEKGPPGGDEQGARGGKTLTRRRRAESARA